MSETCRQTRILGILLLAMAAVHLHTLRPGHDWGGDFSQYVHHAKNVVEGIPYGQTDYIYNRAYATIGPPAYPPICPLLLAPAYLLFGLNFEAMKLVMVLSLVLFLLFLFWCLRRELRFEYAVAVVLLVGLNRHWLGAANSIGSDLPFMALLYLTIFVIQKAYDTPAADPPRLRYLAPGALLMYVCYGARTLGGLLLPSVLAYDLLRYRRITRSAVLAGTVFIALAGLQGILVQGNAAYFDQYETAPGVFVHNGLAYLMDAASFWHNGYFQPLGGLLFLSLSALAALGYVSSVRRRVTLLEIFPVLYMIAVLLFPGYAGPRYLAPLFPLYLLFVFRGLQHAWLVRRTAVRRTVFASLSVAVIGSYLAACTQLRLDVNEGISKAESLALFRFVAGQTDHDDVLIFIKPRVMSLLTSRRTSAYHMPNDDCLLWDYFRRIGATYLVVVENDAAFAYAEDPMRLAYLRDFVKRNSASLNLAFANADFRVYRIAHRDVRPLTRAGRVRAAPHG